MNEEFEMICFGLISSSGGAKSCYVEAIQKAKAGDFEGANQSMEEGDNCFLEAHAVHSELVTKEASGEKIETSLILVHAEDQMANAEIVKILALEIIDLHQKLA